MRRIKSKVFIGVTSIAVLALVVLFFVKGFIGEGESSAIRYKEFQVYKGNFMIAVSANGTVIPIDRVEIKSKASGEIVNLPVEEGDFVKKGALIAQLDQKDEKEQVAQDEANLAIAQAELKQAQRSFDRQEELFKRNLISAEERDQIELSLAIAKGKLVQATTALERSRERLSEAVVRAPIDGVILQKYVEVGQIIASGVSNVSGGTPIVDIAEMSSVYIEAGIDEIDIGKIKVGQTAQVVADAYPEIKFKGKIVRISPEARIEQNVTLFDVIIKVENTDGKLKSGMNANLEITIVDNKDVLLAPAIVFQGVNTSGPYVERSSFQSGGNRGSGRSNQGMMPEQTGNSASIRTTRGQNPSPDKITGKESKTGKSISVLIKQGDHFVPKTVEIGASNFEVVEIISGLEEGDILGVPMVSRLKAENDRMEERIRSDRSFGTTGS
jgi:RND family efflux transporter MFP subunit